MADACHVMAVLPASPGIGSQSADSGGADRLDAAAQAIGGLAGRFKNSYTGLAVSPEHNAIFVYRRPEAAFDVAARAAANGTTLVFCDAVRARSELDRLSAQIAADNAHGQNGFTVYAVAVELDGYLSVGTDKSDVARPYLQARYGTAVRDVAPGAPSENS